MARSRIASLVALMCLAAFAAQPASAQDDPFTGTWVLNVAKSKMQPATASKSELIHYKITGDEEQLCCPTFFTRTFYKWNGKNFQLQKKRLTYSMADKSQPPQENMIEAIEAQSRGKK